MVSKCRMHDRVTCSTTLEGLFERGKKTVQTIYIDSIGTSIYRLLPRLVRGLSTIEYPEFQQEHFSSIYPIRIYAFAQELLPSHPFNFH
jgi:hypothetical protein